MEVVHLNVQQALEMEEVVDVEITAAEKVEQERKPAGKRGPASPSKFFHMSPILNLFDV